MTDIYVTKRDGIKQLIDYEKIHRVVDWASEGLKNVNTSEVVMKAKIKFFDGIKTDDIHQSLIKSAADLIEAHQSDYQILASRLLMFKLRKEAYSGFSPTDFYNHIRNLTKMGKYDKEILEKYSKQDIQHLESIIDHDRDLEYVYAATMQWKTKYLVQDRVTKKVYESPQYAIMLCAMCLFQDSSDRLEKVSKFYDAVSNKKISLPTPIMAGVRTPTRQFSSCVLIDCGDSLDSISATNDAILQYVSRRAGIGINAGAIRAQGSPIRNGEAVHTGVIPFYKMFQSSVHSCSQGGIRRGAATLFYPIWHLEFENLIVLKNNKGVEENRARHLDYGVQLNKLFIERLIKKQNITFFSPDIADGKLYDLFFRDQKKFRRLYEKLENDPTVRKTVKPALEVFQTIMNERSSTGRIYLQNVDRCNENGPFNPAKSLIKQSNLCTEISIPTQPIQKDGSGEIALCTLSAFNVGAIDDLSELKELSELIVEALDNLLDYQDYPLPQSEWYAKARRNLGIGVTNYAYFLAKNNVKYSDGSANNLTHELFEAIQYYLLKASCKLAKERGKCELFEDTRYADGELPIDWYETNVDSYVTTELKQDWEELRSEIKQYGLRHSVLSAQMPCESSSYITNSTNGIEPARALVVAKENKDMVIKQAYPDIANLFADYETLWSITDNTGYLTLTGIMQKFIDQAISINTNYKPSNYPNNKVPLSVLLKDLVHWYKMGNKTMYYHNTEDGNNQDEGCEGGACKL